MTKKDDDLARRDKQASSNGVATASAVREGSAHTPAPWYVGAQNDALFITTGRAPSLNNDYPNHDAKRTVIASVSQENEDANASLIAAAPRMYDRIAKLAADGDAESVAILGAVHGR